MGHSTRKTLTGAAYITGQTLVLNAISLPATAYVIRGLGGFRYGQWAVASAVVATTAVITNPGLRDIFLRAAARNPELAAERLAEQIGARGLLALVAGIAALGLCLALRYPPTIVACVAVGALSLLIAVTASSAGGLLIALERLGTLVPLHLTPGVVSTAASVVAVATGTGPIGLTVAYTAAPGTSLVLLLIALRRQEI